MDVLAVKKLKKYYGQDDTLVKALNGVDLTIKKGEFVSLVGSSGSGKSTLLNILGGLDQPSQGEVIVEDHYLNSMTPDEVTIFRRRRIGVVFQNYNLLPLLNVYENIVLPIQLDGKKPDQKFIAELLAVLGLEDKKFSMPNQLSGGQQQRVAIARAIAAKPAIILADEPTGNLDSETSLDVLGLLKITAEKYRQTILMITHDHDIARMAGRIIRLEDGRIQGDDI